MRRLGKLASLLARYGIDDQAPDTETEFLVKMFLAEKGRRKNTADFKAVVKDSGVLDVRVVQWRYEPR